MIAKIFKLNNGTQSRTVVAFQLSADNSQSDNEVDIMSGMIPTDSSSVYLVDLETNRAASHFCEWSDKLMRDAHIILSQHWDTLQSGNIIDIQNINV